MIAIDSAGRHLVLADDNELLVHDGHTGAPRWLRECNSPLVEVGATSDFILSLDEDGHAVWYDPISDAVRASADAGDLARAGAVSPDGRLLVATADGAVELLSTGPGRSFAWPGATVVAWGPGDRLLIADDAGKLGIFAAGVLVEEARLDGPAVAAAWNPRGFWVLATARELVRLEAGELHPLTSAPADGPIRHLACSLDGDALALALGDGLVVVLSWPARDTIAQLHYLDRAVTGLQFGPAPWLAIGLDGGDGNKFDLRTGDLHRTDTQPGREHRRWLVRVSVDPPAAAPSPTPPPAAPSPTPPPAAKSASIAPVALALVFALPVVLALALVVALLAWLAF